jgi:hypothetical protein
MIFAGLVVDENRKSETTRHRQEIKSAEHRDRAICSGDNVTRRTRFPVANWKRNEKLSVLRESLINRDNIASILVARGRRAIKSLCQLIYINCHP